MRGRSRTRLVLFARERCESAVARDHPSRGPWYEAPSVVADRPKSWRHRAAGPSSITCSSQLRSQGVSDVVLCVGHRRRADPGHFGNGDRPGMRLRYSVEHEPLGTAGALRLALNRCSTPRNACCSTATRSLAPTSQPLLAMPGARAARPASSRCVGSRMQPGRYGTVELAARRPGHELRREGRRRTTVPGTDQRRRICNRPVRHREIPAGRPASFERDILPALASTGALYGA